MFAALAVISGCADGKVTSETKPAETTTPAGTEKKGAAEVRTAEDLAGKKVIAFTFDDGPNTKATAELLDIAEEYGVKFSFFVIGQNISEESAAVMKRAHDMGCEINSHSFTHSYMDKMSAEDIKDEMQRTSDLIFEHTGELPHFFQPPYIAVNRTMYDSIDLPFICGIGCGEMPGRMYSPATRSDGQSEDRQRSSQSRSRAHEGRLRVRHRHRAVQRQRGNAGERGAVQLRHCHRLGRLNFIFVRRKFCGGQKTYTEQIKNCHLFVTFRV